MILPLLRWSALRRERALTLIRDFERLTGRTGYSDLPWGEVEERCGMTPEDLVGLLRPFVAELALRREVWIKLRKLRRAAIDLGIWGEFRGLWREATANALRERPLL